MTELRQTGQNDASLFVRVAGLVFLPVAAPLIIWRNVGGYADRFAALPGIQRGGGLISGIAAFLYIALFLCIIGGSVLATSAANVGLDVNTSDSTSSSATTETVTMTGTPHSTARERSQSPTISKEEISSGTPTSGAKLTEDQVYGFENRSAYLAAQYGEFMDAYVNLSVTTADLNITNYSVDGSNKSAKLRWTTNPENSTRVVDEWRTVMVHYAGLSEEVRESERLPEEMIPKRMNFVTYTQTGELYRTSYVTYESAKRFTMNETDPGEYSLLYYYHAEKGPGHPDYEPAQETAQASA